MRLFRDTILDRLRFEMQGRRAVENVDLDVHEFAGLGRAVRVAEAHQHPRRWDQLIGPVGSAPLGDAMRTIVKFDINMHKRSLF